jgi:hypothetical protein
LIEHVRFVVDPLELLLLVEPLAPELPDDEPPLAPLLPPELLLEDVLDDELHAMTAKTSPTHTTIFVRMSRTIAGQPTRGKNQIV